MRIVTRDVESYERRRDENADLTEEQIQHLGRIENTGEVPMWARPPRWGGCEWYSGHVASTLYMSHNINAIDVFTRKHVFVMAETTDKGTVIIDPTIRQVFHDYPNKVFIGTPDELRALINAHGGPEALVVHAPLTPRPRLKDYYEHPHVETTGLMDDRANQFHAWRKSWQGMGEFTPEWTARSWRDVESERPDTHAERMEASRTPNKFQR